MRARLLGIGVLLAGCGAVAVSISTGAEHGAEPAAARADTTKGHLRRADCTRGEPVGFMGVVAQGVTAADLAAVVHLRSPDVAVAGEIAGKGRRSAFFHGPHAKADIEQVLGTKIITRGAAYYRRAADPELLSCDYELADRPAAAPLVKAARAAILDAGLASADAIDVRSPMTAVTENPLAEGEVLVSFQVPDHALEPGPGVPGDAWSSTWVVASVDETTLQVTSVGEEAEEQ